MLNFGRRVFAMLALIGSAVAMTIIGTSLSNADEAKVPDLSELREAISTAAKRGDNVDEVRKAFETFEKSIGKGWTAPEPGKRVEPPAELAALHDVVESAAKKGENVEEIRKQLEIVERALLGKSLTKPKPVPRDPVPQPENPNPFQGPGRRPAFVQPILPGAAVDPAAVQKAQEMMRKAAETLQNNPNDPEARRLMQQAQEMLLKAMLAGGGGIPPLGGMDFGRGQDRVRLGVRLERVTELAADQLGLEVARGVGIAGVVEGSPAEKAGFKTHDIVLEFAGKPVSDIPEEFTRLVNQIKAGEKVDAVVMRKGKKVEIKGIELADLGRDGFRLDPVEGGLPQFQVLPIPAPPVLEGRKLQRQGGDADGQVQGRNSVSYSLVNGQLSIKAIQDNVTYVITGQRTGDTTEISKVTITDGKKKVEADSLEKVPDDYRPTVERLIKNGRVGR